MIAALILAAALQTGPTLPADKAARADRIAGELRCVVCQNQSVRDSDAPLAADMRALVAERVAKGESDDAVREHLVARYGEYVLLAPRHNARNAPLWWGPVLLLGVGGIVVWRLGRRGADVPFEEETGGD
ncbi:cytochrome c-type biogenesis protein [Parvularcula dongshanensis]|uniref:Cytochrome c-type biogenesis protein n=1 Tax=Parvularcula dongshanensis TaxID=1173995 RepID=A0A840I0T6_9PROT|nr:cytochrome c-type biogenesis protein [Parvularcula dongshanensis]MBB4658676.1 cytochrome c-type biogenesis protein CcmH [Parvularcula dongshanensis]